MSGNINRQRSPKFKGLLPVKLEQISEKKKIPPSEIHPSIQSTCCNSPVRHKAVHETCNFRYWFVGIESRDLFCSSISCGQSLSTNQNFWKKKITVKKLVFIIQFNWQYLHNISAQCLWENQIFFRIFGYHFRFTIRPHFHNKSTKHTKYIDIFYD
jgi:hypothetical protein